jgi:hypothetical protein
LWLSLPCAIALAALYALAVGALLMRTLADQRALDAKAVARLGQQAWELVQSWAQQGWLQARAG